MERKIYQFTEQQEKKFSHFPQLTQPTDDEFQETWKRQHHGKLTGWGMGKRNWIVGNMKFSREYQLGLWQARLDVVAGLDYQSEPLTDENTSAYNVGYYRGYTEPNIDDTMLVNLKSQLEA